MLALLRIRRRRSQNQALERDDGLVPERTASPERGIFFNDCVVRVGGGVVTFGGILGDTAAGAGARFSLVDVFAFAPRARFKVNC